MGFEPALVDAEIQSIADHYGSFIDLWALILKYGWYPIQRLPSSPFHLGIQSGIADSRLLFWGDTITSSTPY